MSDCAEYYPRILAYDNNDLILINCKTTRDNASYILECIVDI